MAKKKTSKTSAKKNDSYAAELWGVLLILIAIMGFGGFGPVGQFIRGFAIFLMGTWYNIALVISFIVGCFLVVKRKMPKFISVRLLGIYLIILTILAWAHMTYAIEENLAGKAIIEATINNFVDMNIVNYPVNSGGGIIGGLLTIALTSAFDFKGTKIVLIILSILGAILSFDISVSDILDFFKKII